ncbi:hypothetical protein MDAP_001050 [Mitosporidium daphniae]
MNKTVLASSNNDKDFFKHSPRNEVHPDAFPSIYDLFLEYNGLYFEGKLSSVTVKWSSKMTLCAGLCCYHRRTGSCTIKLSEPILKFRPVEDLKDTLLHEMIHAYLFVSARSTDRDGHGPDFQALMRAINVAANSNITVYHSFHGEVNYYKRHIWRCSGICRERPPFYGWVRRAMNREPQKADSWFKSHLEACGGTFVKISEPFKPAKSNAKERKHNKIVPYFPGRILGSNGKMPVFRERQLRTLNDSASKPFIVAEDETKGKAGIFDGQSVTDGQAKRPQTLDLQKANIGSQKNPFVISDAESD